jgi:hypothetical protein
VSNLLPKALNPSLNPKGFFNTDLKVIWLIKDHRDRREIVKIAPGRETKNAD